MSSLLELNQHEHIWQGFESNVMNGLDLNSTINKNRKVIQATGLD